MTDFQFRRAVAKELGALRKDHTALRDAILQQNERLELLAEQQGKMSEALEAILEGPGEMGEDQGGETARVSRT